MTTELQTAMARYEGARIQYRKAVLASLNGTTGGEAIRAAIIDFKSASADLKRLQPSRRAVVVESARPANEPWAVLTGLDFFRKLLKAS